MKLMRLSMPMICNIRSKGMITTTSSLLQGQLGNQKGYKFRMITCSASPTGWLQTRNLRRQSVRKCWRNRPIPLTYLLCTGHQLWLLEERFCSSISHHQDFKQLLRPSFLFRLLSGLRHHLLQIWPCCLKISMLKRCQALPISTLMGKS